MSYEAKSLNEECGIFGIWGHPDAAQVTYFGLHSLQHRGQEGAGIVANNSGKLDGHRDLGLLAEVFQKQEQLKERRLLVMCAMQPLVRVAWIIFSHFYLNFMIVKLG